MIAIGFIAAQNAVVMLPPLLNDIGRNFQVSDSLAGQLNTATGAGWAIAAIMVGPLSDSFGRRPVAVGSLLLTSLAVLAAAFAPNIAVLLMLRALTGLAGGGIPPNGMAAVADIISPNRRSQAVGALMGLVMLSGAITVPLLALLADYVDQAEFSRQAANILPLLADWQGWRYALLAWAAVLTAAFLANWLWFPPDRRRRIRDFSFLSRYRSLLSMRFFQAGITLNVCHRIAFWGTLTYMVTYLIETYGITTGASAIPVFISAIAQGAGSYSAAFITKRNNRGTLLAIIMALGGACGLAFFLFPLGLWQSVTLAAACTGLLSVTFPAMIAMSTEISGASRATGVGLMGLTNQLGLVGGAAIGGILLANIGYPAIGYMSLTLGITSAITAAAFIRQPQPTNP